MNEGRVEFKVVVNYAFRMGHVKAPRFRCWLMYATGGDPGIIMGMFTCYGTSHYEKNLTLTQQDSSYPLLFCKYETSRIADSLNRSQVAGVSQNSIKFSGLQVS